MKSLKILLDECIDRRLAREIPGHTARTVHEEGWAGLKNGQLLAQAAGKFDVFLTVDRNLTNQQNLSKFEIAVVVIRSKSNSLKDLRKAIPSILTALTEATPRTVTVVGG